MDGITDNHTRSAWATFPLEKITSSASHLDPAMSVGWVLHCRLQVSRDVMKECDLHECGTISGVCDTPPCNRGLWRGRSYWAGPRSSNTSLHAARDSLEIARSSAQRGANCDRLGLRSTPFNAQSWPRPGLPRRLPSQAAVVPHPGSRPRRHRRPPAQTQCGSRLAGLPGSQLQR